MELQFDGKSVSQIMCEEMVPDSSDLWVPVIGLFISVIGLIFNSIAIFVIIVLKDFNKSISHWYVLQLAIADSVFLALLPLKMAQRISGRWVMGEGLCKAYQGVFMINYYSGIFFLTVMSFDRYAAIVHPVSAQWRRFRTHGNAVIITIAVWTCSILISSPLWIFAQVECVCNYKFPYTDEEFQKLHGMNSSVMTQLQNEYPEEFWVDDGDSYLDENGTYIYQDGNNPEDMASCHSHSYQSYVIWVYSNFIVGFIIPVAIMSVCYSFILWRVLHPAIKSSNRNAGRRKSSDAPPRGRNSILSSLRLSSTSSSGSTGKPPKALSQKQRVTSIVISLVVMFITCWLPFHATLLAKLRGIPYGMHTCNVITDVTSLLAYSNSMLNPIFYTFLGSRFYRRLSTAASSFRRNRRSRFNGFNYTGNTRTRAPTSGKSYTANGTKFSDASSGHHTVHSSVKLFHASNDLQAQRGDLQTPRGRLLATYDSEDHQRAQNIELKQMAHI